jgi:hypothetical protein
LSFLEALQMKSTLILLAFVLAVGATVDAQVAPAATGGAATLSYVFRLSQTDVFGPLGNWQTIVPSASVDYSNGGTRYPFNLNYGGGYTATINGPTYETGLFQHLLLSQGIDWHKWRVTVNDDVSYTPQAPTTGFTGIPGIGEPVGGEPPSDQSILTLKTHVVNNLAGVNVNHPFNYATTFNAGMTSELRRYPDGNGLNINQLMANASVSRRLDARNSLTGNFTFSQFSYPDADFSFHSDAVEFGFTRAWNAKISSSISAGPEWKGSSDSAVVPSSMTVAANADVIYQYRFVTASLTYARGASNGGGYLFGAETDTVSANYTQKFGRKLTIGLTGDFRRTAGLINDGETNSKYGAVQVTRSFGRHYSAFASYTAIDQSSSLNLSPGLTLPPQANILTNLLQVVGFGVSYTPQRTHLVN